MLLTAGVRWSHLPLSHSPLAFSNPHRRDGFVETLFSVDSDKVDEMQQRCRRGPEHAVVTSFECFPSSDVPEPGFQRKSTV